MEKKMRFRIPLELYEKLEEIAERRGATVEDAIELLITNPALNK